MIQQLSDMLLADTSRFNIDRIAVYIGTDEKLFADLVHLMHNSQYPVSLRASWAMSAITDNHPWLVSPYFRLFIDSLPTYSHSGIIRNVLRLFSLIEIPEEYAGEIYHLSCNVFYNQKMPIAVRINAMQILFNIAMNEPDLKKELILILEENCELESAGIVSRASKLIRLLSQKTSN